MQVKKQKIPVKTAGESSRDLLSKTKKYQSNYSIISLKIVREANFFVISSENKIGDVIHMNLINLFQILHKVDVYQTVLPHAINKYNFICQFKSICKQIIGPFSSKDRRMQLFEKNICAINHPLNFEKGKFRKGHEVRCALSWRHTLL